eukprot:gene15239-biopygen18691
MLTWHTRARSHNHRRSDMLLPKEWRFGGRVCAQRHRAGGAAGSHKATPTAFTGQRHSLAHCGEGATCVCFW